MERQLPDALDLVTRALRAGHSFASGVQMIGEEMAEPIASEFRMVADEVNFGVSLQQALTNLSERVPLTDLRYFVVAVLIQRDSGGNLTEVLGNLSRSSATGSSCSRGCGCCRPKGGCRPGSWGSCRSRWRGS
jgi:tight adherence protein B